MNWDLSVFYKDFNDPQLRADIDAVKEILAGADALFSGSDCVKTKLEKMIASEEEVSRLLNDAFGFIMLTLAVDATNEDALRLQGEMSQLMVSVQLNSSKFARFVGGVENLDEVIAQSEVLTANALHI